MEAGYLDGMDGGAVRWRRLGFRAVILIRAAAVAAAVALLAVGCGDDQPDRPAGSPSSDECRASTAALDAERAGLDLEYQSRIDEWEEIEASGDVLDAEWDDFEAAKSVFDLDSDVSDGSEASRAKALASDWDRLKAEWARIEAKLEVFIDAAASAPAAADWPLDPRRHSDRWPDMFQRRAALNDEWSDLAGSMSDLFKQMSGLYSEAAATGSSNADLAGRLSDLFAQRSDLYDRYASSTLRWSDHWAAEASWHQRTADLAWNCRESSA